MDIDDDGTVYLTGKNGYIVHEKPKQLSTIYGEKWGMEPDFAIENISNSKGTSDMLKKAQKYNIPTKLIEQ